MISDMIKYLYINIYLQYSNVVSFKVAKEGGYVISKCKGKGWMTCNKLKDAFEKNVININAWNMCHSVKFF